jgi:hypothetical protein
LVRVLTSIEGGETEADAQARAIQFAQEIAPSLDTHIPR